MFMQIYVKIQQMVQQPLFKQAYSKGILNKDGSSF